MLESGVQAITMGNHTWDKKDIFQFIDEATYMVRPANLPPGTPGKEVVFVKSNGKEIAVINILGRTFMQPADDPFRKIDELLKLAKKKNQYRICRFSCRSDK